MNESIWLGVLWAGGSAFGFAFYQIANRRLVHQASVYRTTFLSLLCCVVVGAILVPFLEKPETWHKLTALALVWFAASGLLHFGLGWTVLSLAQRAIGAARTSPLTSSSVVLSALVGTWLFAEPFNLTLVGGVALMAFGVYLISRVEASGQTFSSSPWRGVLFGLFAGACWAISPIFFRWGYAIVPSAFLAALTGLWAGAIVSGGLWLFKRHREGRPPSAEKASLLPPNSFWLLQALAGLVVGLSIFARWISLTYLPIVSVNALSMLNIPTVVLLAPLVFGKRLERTGWTLWSGTLCTLGGIGLTLLGGI